MDLWPFRIATFQRRPWIFPVNPRSHIVLRPLVNRMEDSTRIERDIRIALPLARDPNHG